MMQHLKVMLTVHVLNTLELTLLLMLTATIIVSLVLEGRVIIPNFTRMTLCGMELAVHQKIAVATMLGCHGFIVS